MSKTHKALCDVALNLNGVVMLYQASTKRDIRTGKKGRLNVRFVGRELDNKDLNDSKHHTSSTTSSELHKLPALIHIIDGIRDGEPGLAADESVCVIARVIHPTPLSVCKFHRARIPVVHVVNVALSSESVVLLCCTDI